MSSRFLRDGIGRRLLVEVDRHAEALGDRGADLRRQRHALGHRHALDRNERHDVDGAEPRMLALVRAADRSPATALLEERERWPASIGAASPASVKTERLCDGSDE